MVHKWRWFTWLQHDEAANHSTNTGCRQPNHGEGTTLQSKLQQPLQEMVQDDDRKKPPASASNCASTCVLRTFGSDNQLNWLLGLLSVWEGQHGCLSLR